MKIERFEDIEAWKLGRETTKKVYSAIANQDRFSKDWGLKDQITRAAGSIMHNVAEGFDAGSDAEFIRFLRYALRSCTEVQSALYVALDQQYIAQPVFDDLYEVARQAKSAAGGFIKYLKASQLRSKYSKPPGPRTMDQGPRTKD